MYVAAGWSTLDPGVGLAWIVGKSAVVGFVARPVPRNAVVEAELSVAQAYLPHGKREAQRVAVRFNGLGLGSFVVDEQTPTTLKVAIPAAVWNPRAEAFLTMDFPDAVSPREAGEGTDGRPRAISLEKITFRVIKPGDAP